MFLPRPLPSTPYPLFQPTCHAPFTLQEIREAFDLFDTDGSGTIDAKVRTTLHAPRIPSSMTTR
jgi:hypothetical protein